MRHATPSTRSMSMPELLSTLPQVGQLRWIGLRPARGVAMTTVEGCAVTETGLEGDRYLGGSGKRAITLLQWEHLPAIAACLQRPEVDPALLRRNLLVAGINLLALKHQRFSVGEVVLECTGLCHPCSKMEAVLGPGGYNALRGHGGITARVIRTGAIRTGDRVQLQR